MWRRNGLNRLCVFAPEADVYKNKSYCVVCFVFLFGVGITKVMFLWPEFKRLRTTRITQTLQLQSSLSSEICYITLLREEASSQFMIPTKYVIWQIFPVMFVISRFISRLKSLQQDENKLICSIYTFLK